MALYLFFFFIPKLLFFLLSLSSRIDQKVSNSPYGYRLQEAQAILTEVRSIRDAISSGEKEKQELMQVKLPDWKQNVLLFFFFSLHLWVDLQRSACLDVSSRVERLRVDAVGREQLRLISDLCV